MQNQGVSDIDVLALSVRDPESMKLINEAIAAYRGGALRSAIMSTWIAVAYDIIAKARELASQGEGAPQQFVYYLEVAINGDNIKKLQDIERDLLKTANEDLQLFAPHEFHALERLRKDRHLCAHPAFVVEDELYQPTPELVRCHIVHALKYLLIHAPLQGKSAINRFDIDVKSASFPISSEDIGTYIRAKYLDRAKDALVVNLIKGIISAPFGTERSQYSSLVRRLTLTLREIAKAKTTIYDAVMPGYVAQKFEQVGDDCLLSICPFLESDERIWGWLSKPVCLRVRRLLETQDIESLKTNSAFDAFSIPELGEILLARFDAFDPNAQINIISEHPRKELVSRGIELYALAGNFRYAEELGKTVVLPLAPFLVAEDIKAIVDAVHMNGQIWNAAGTPEILEAVYDQTQVLLPESRQYWQAFVDARIEDIGDASKYYAYPGIQRRLAN